MSPGRVSRFPTGSVSDTPTGGPVRYARTNARLTMIDGRDVDVSSSDRPRPSTTRVPSAAKYAGLIDRRFAWISFAGRPFVGGSVKPTGWSYGTSGSTLAAAASATPGACDRRAISASRIAARRSLVYRRSFIGIVAVSR